MYIKKGLPSKDKDGNRLYYARGLYVSRDGKTIYNLQDNTSYPHYYRPHPDSTGRLYITNEGTKLYVDELVATCFRPKPKDDKQYKLKHIDGNNANNLAANLDWEPVLPSPYVVNMESDCKVGGLTVRCDGTVYDGKNLLNVSDFLFDSDIELFVTIAPHVVYQGKRVRLSDLVASAHFVYGEKDNLVVPQILHKDHDPMNFERENLQWVDKDSQEYQDYLVDYKRWEYNNNIKLNPGKQFPDFMQPKI